MQGHALGEQIRTGNCSSAPWRSLAFTLEEYHPWAGVQFGEYRGRGEMWTDNTLQVWGESTGAGAKLVYWPRQQRGAGARHDTFEFIPV
ncbi:hypothetical protein [Streptomyces uncialis]|uniref:hypothetical protein n=1 Tax=Streptomyces uncialis TaxID=1048205 RepID=UPI00386C817E|nr:hypothetical protein OG924_29815 [Streptomyces uncialis]